MLPSAAAARLLPPDPPVAAGRVPVRAVHQTGQVAADARAGRDRPPLIVGRGSVMLQDLAALTPPAIVCAAVLIGAWAIVRRELAPKRKERAEAAATADEERAVDRGHGRSLYSRHQRFI
jgi:hypothetical protein